MQESKDFDILSFGAQQSIFFHPSKIQDGKRRFTRSAGQGEIRIPNAMSRFEQRIQSEEDLHGSLVDSGQNAMQCYWLVILNCIESLDMGEIDIFVGRELEFGIHMLAVTPFTKSEIDLYWMSTQYIW
jgi:hypothetical protein